MNNTRIQVVQKGKKQMQQILYIMHNAFRINDNHSIEYIQSFQEAQKTIVLVEPLDENQRNIDFFTSGILGYKEVFASIFDDVYHAKSVHGKELLDISMYDLIVIDMPYLKEEIARINVILNRINPSQTVQYIESNVIVPVRAASDKEEYSARTLRPKIWDKLPAFLDLDTSYSSFLHYEQKALQVLEAFIMYKLPFYDQKNHPEKDFTSGLSPYLKYGFISPLTIYQKLQHIDHPNKDIFLEELLIRRDLSYNFIYYNKGYDQFDQMTYEWAYLSMKQHEFDEKEYIYTIDDYINFQTHDPYFNAAMKQMVYFGEMHGYMRMYWAKKIIEWSYTFEDAYRIALYLNNYYFIDGNTPNGYTGVAWCFGKHDRAWPERKIFGKLRYMNAGGLKRKFDIDQYVEHINKKVRNLDENVSAT
jgi:deoxyribodipyrimidine photo-lyase